MYYSRIIPCLLLKDKGLVKTVKFHKTRYIGDPINAVKIFNDKEVDELILLDIGASKNNSKPDFNFLKKIAGQCFMPLCYGGGINSIDDMRALFKIGFEKVAINSSFYFNPYLLNEAASIFGNQSIVVSIDVKRNIFGKYFVKILNGTKNTKMSPTDYAILAEKNGAGEILLNSIDNDGTMAGYDLEIIKQVSQSVGIPVVACGGAGSFPDIRKVIYEGKASAAAAGSIFVYYGVNKAVLINYPDQINIKEIFK